MKMEELSNSTDDLHDGLTNDERTSSSPINEEQQQQQRGSRRKDSKPARSLFFDHTVRESGNTSPTKLLNEDWKDENIELRLPRGSFDTLPIESISNSSALDDIADEGTPCSDDANDMCEGAMTDDSGDDLVDKEVEQEVTDDELYHISISRQTKSHSISSPSRASTRERADSSASETQSKIHHSSSVPLFDLVHTRPGVTANDFLGSRSRKPTVSSNSLIVLSPDTEESEKIGEDGPSNEDNVYQYSEDNDTDEAYLETEEEGGKTRVVAGNMRGLLNRLCSSERVQHEFIETFLMTYRYIMTSDDLFDDLKRRYHAAVCDKPCESHTHIADDETPGTVIVGQVDIHVSSDDVERQVQGSTNINNKPYIGAIPVNSKVTQLRIINLIEKWLFRHFEDFSENDGSLLVKLNMFIESELLSNSFMLALGEKLQRIIKEKQKVKMEGKKHLQLLDLNPQELAEQLTLVESRLFRRIERSELCLQAWNKSSKNFKAPNVTALIEWFNHVALWAASEVCSESNLRQRVLILRRLIQIAKICIDLRNFNTALEILAGLNLSCVQRLKKTWKRMPDRADAVWLEMNDLMSARRGYHNFREYSANLSLPLLPYMGMYLNNLVLIEEGNLTRIGGASQRINYRKLELLTQIMKEFRYYQNSEFLFEPNYNVQEWFRTGMVVLEEDILYQKSLEIEPRGEKTRVSVDDASIHGIIDRRKELLVVPRKSFRLRRSKGDDVDNVSVRSSVSLTDQGPSLSISEFLNGHHDGNSLCSVSSTSVGPPSPRSTKLSHLRLSSAKKSTSDEAEGGADEEYSVDIDEVPSNRGLSLKEFLDLDRIDQDSVHMMAISNMEKKGFRRKMGQIFRRSNPSVMRRKSDGESNRYSIRSSRLKKNSAVASLPYLANNSDESSLNRRSISLDSIV